MLCELGRNKPFITSDYVVNARFPHYVHVRLDGVLILPYTEFVDKYEGKPFRFSDTIKFLLLKDRYYPGYFDLSYILNRYGRQWSIPFYYDSENNYIAVESECNVSDIIVPGFDTVETIYNQITRDSLILQLVYCNGKLYEIRDGKVLEYCPVSLAQ